MTWHAQLDIYYTAEQLGRHRCLREHDEGIEVDSGWYEPQCGSCSFGCGWDHQTPARGQGLLATL